MRTPSCTLLLALVAAAQEPTPPPSPAHFRERRVAVMEAVKQKLEEGERAVVLVRGAPTSPEMAPFYQDHEFWYLSGVAEADLELLLFPASGADVLLVPPFNRFTANWDGERLAPGEAAAKATGFQRVGSSRSLKSELEAALAPDAGGRRPVLFTLLQPAPNRTSTAGQMGKAQKQRTSDPFDGRPSREQVLRENLELQFPDLVVRDLAPIVNALRGVKTPEELDQVKAACRIAAEGMAEAMKSATPGMYEFQIAAVAHYVHSRHGAPVDAYGAIVGAGPNGCVLHYMANSRKTVDGDLVVMDYAPSVNGYCADVTRTFPVNGKFTAAQRKLVEDVYEVQQAVIREIRPGRNLGELEAISMRMLAEKGYRSMHGICHHVGLAVHDVGGGELAPGMVFTVEPGAYLPDKGMGCRIEDVVLVTGDGCVVLSSALPAKPDDIEALMRKKGIGNATVGLEAGGGVAK
jgi:Xaa-Pro aminopeptidase